MIMENYTLYRVDVDVYVNPIESKYIYAKSEDEALIFSEQDFDVDDLDFDITHNATEVDFSNFSEFGYRYNKSVHPIDPETGCEIDLTINDLHLLFLKKKEDEEYRKLHQIELFNI